MYLFVSCFCYSSQQLPCFTCLFHHFYSPFLRRGGGGVNFPFKVSILCYLCIFLYFHLFLFYCWLFVCCAELFLSFHRILPFKVPNFVPFYKTLSFLSAIIVFWLNCLYLLCNFPILGINSFFIHFPILGQIDIALSISLFWVKLTLLCQFLFFGSNWHCSVNFSILGQINIVRSIYLFWVNLTLFGQFPYFGLIVPFPSSLVVYLTQNCACNFHMLNVIKFFIDSNSQ